MGKFSVKDHMDKDVLAEIVPHAEDPDRQQIVIVDIYAGMEITLNLREAYRIGAALKLLSKIAEKEDAEIQERLCNQEAS